MAVQREIWERIAVHDQEAYAEVYRYLFNRLYNYGAKFTRDTVLIEDSVQETLLLVWEKRADFSSYTYVETYFFSAFRNILLTKLNHKVKPISDEIPDDAEFSVESMIIEKEVDQQLKARMVEAIEGLTSRQKEAIFLRFYEGMSFDNVATVMGITTKASYKVVARALVHLKELLMVIGAVMLVHSLPLH